jgi:hypothetical protein
MYCPDNGDDESCPMTQQIETHYWWDDIKTNVVAGKAMMAASIVEQRSEL